MNDHVPPVFTRKCISPLLNDLLIYILSHERCLVILNQKEYFCNQVEAAQGQMLQMSCCDTSSINIF